MGDRERKTREYFLKGRPFEDLTPSERKEYLDLIQFGNDRGLNFSAAASSQFDNDYGYSRFNNEHDYDAVWLRGIGYDPDGGSIRAIHDNTGVDSHDYGDIEHYYGKPDTRTTYGAYEEPQSCWHHTEKTNADKELGADTSLRKAYDRATKELDDYESGKYQYNNEKGWHLKDNLNESIRRAIRRRLR